MSIIKTLMFLALFMVTGCASIKGTTYFEPENLGHGWYSAEGEKGFLVFGEMPSDVSYKCGETTLTFKSVPITSVATFGPPMIPFPFPMFAEMPEELISILVNVQSKTNNTKVLSAILEFGDQSVEPVEIISHEIKSNNNTLHNYVYKHEWRSLERFVFQLHASDAACGILSVPYSRQRHITYSML